MSNWISLKERWPRRYERVFVFNGIGVTTGFWNYSVTWMRDKYHTLNPPPTHWMPMPEMPVMPIPEPPEKARSGGKKN